MILFCFMSEDISLKRLKFKFRCPIIGHLFFVEALLWDFALIIASLVQSGSEAREIFDFASLVQREVDCEARRKDCK